MSTEGVPEKAASGPEGPSGGGVAGEIVGFCRFARSHGLNFGVAETLDSLSAARLGVLLDGELFRAALRSLLCASKQDCDRFDRLFEVYWSGRWEELKQTSPNPTVDSPPPRPAATSLLMMGMAGQEAEPADEGKSSAGASQMERLRRTDFSKTPIGDQELLEQLALRLWRRMSRRLARRLKPDRSKRQVDLRRTIRRSVSRGGDPMDLSFRGKKPRRPGLALLLDVSGSMDRYSFFLLRFVYALQKHFQKVDSFLFSTRLTCVTDALRARALAGVLAELEESAEAWSSGTRIGACLKEFNDAFARRVLSRRSLVLILSDGLDTGEPEALETELRRIKLRARKVIWLNPLLGMPGYQPLARGMRTALPLVDAFLSAHNLESLLEVERHLIHV